MKHSILFKEMNKPFDVEVDEKEFVRQGHGLMKPYGKYCYDCTDQDMSLGSTDREQPFSTGGSSWTWLWQLLPQQGPKGEWQWNSEEAIEDNPNDGGAYDRPMGIDVRGSRIKGAPVQKLKHLAKTIDRHGKYIMYYGNGYYFITYSDWLTGWGNDLNEMKGVWNTLTGEELRIHNDETEIEEESLLDPVSPAEFGNQEYEADHDIDYEQDEQSGAPPERTNPTKPNNKPNIDTEEWFDKMTKDGKYNQTGKQGKKWKKGDKPIIESWGYMGTQQPKGYENDKASGMPDMIGEEDYKLLKKQIGRKK